MGDYFEPSGLGLTIELAWAAGFFDGEGCITLSRGNPMIQIAQVDREVLDRFKNAIGNVGNVNGPYQMPNSSKPQYRYQLHRIDDVREVVRKITPFVSSIKKEKMKLLIDATAYKKGRSHRKLKGV